MTTADALSLVSISPVDAPHLEQRCDLWLDRKVQDFRTFLGHAHRIYSHYQFLIKNITYVALNTLTLLGFVFTSIPKYIPHLAAVALSVIGVTYLPEQVKNLIKLVHDVRFAIASGDFGAIMETALKTAIAASNIFLTIASLAATACTFLGFPAATLAIYAFTLPLSLGSFYADIGVNIADFFLTRNLFNEMRSSNFSKEEKEKFKTNLQSLADHQCIESTHESQMAIRAVRKLDLFDLAALDYSKTEHSFYDQVTLTLSSKCSYKAKDLILRALGFVALGIGRTYPGTIYQAGSTWTMSVLWLALEIDRLVNSKKISKEA